MQVTHANIDAVADDIIRLLETCEFYALDQEMTGINAPGFPDDSYAHTPAQAYPAKRHAATVYNAFQIGICTFHRVSQDKYEARPFNFWLRQRAREAADIPLNLSAVDFLLSNSMNFQKWLNEGLNYSNDERDVRTSARLLGLTPPNVSDEELAWVTDALTDLRAWYSTDDAEKTDFVETWRHLSTNADFLLWLSIRDAGLFVDVQPPLHNGFPPRKRKETTFKKISAENFGEAAQKHRSEAEERVRQEKGFRRIWECLLRIPQTPMVGHNYSSDLMFLLNMHHGVLPESYGEFKAAVHKLFPRIYDTKVLASELPAAPLANTSLGPLFDSFQPRRPAHTHVRLPLGFEHYHAGVIRREPKGSGGAAHQGAYDAYMTGVVYLNFIHAHSRERVEQLENRVAVFGNAYSIQFGRASDTLGGSSAFSLLLPLRLPLRCVERALMTPDEAELEAKGQRCNGFFLRPVPGAPSRYVLTLPPTQQHRVEMLRLAVTADPSLSSITIEPFLTELPHD